MHLEDLENTIHDSPLVIAPATSIRGRAPVVVAIVSLKGMCGRTFIGDGRGNGDHPISLLASRATAAIHAAPVVRALSSKSNLLECAG